MTWKGYSTPIGSTTGTIRPLTNNDSTNIYESAFGLPRPIKCARRGRNISGRMNRRENTSVKFTLDTPGGYNIITNDIKNKIKCCGNNLVASYYPNKLFITDNPQIKVNSPFTAERKARRRVVSASTLLKPNYFTTMQRYRENRCLTYDQRAFNFLSKGGEQGNPGDPNTINNIYYANCNRPNDPIDVVATSCVPAYTIEPKQACSTVAYKPNNYQFAQQGAVSSSTRMLKLTTETSTKSAYNFVNGKKVAHTTKFINNCC